MLLMRDATRGGYEADACTETSDSTTVEAKLIEQPPPSQGTTHTSQSGAILDRFPACDSKNPSPKLPKIANRTGPKVLVFKDVASRYASPPVPASPPIRPVTAMRIMATQGPHEVIVRAQQPTSLQGRRGRGSPASVFTTAGVPETSTARAPFETDPQNIPDDSSMVDTESMVECKLTPFMTRTNLPSDRIVTEDVTKAAGRSPACLQPSMPPSEKLVPSIVSAIEARSTNGVLSEQQSAAPGNQIGLKPTAYESTDALRRSWHPASSRLQTEPKHDDKTPYAGNYKKNRTDVANRQTNCPVAPPNLDLKIAAKELGELPKVRKPVVPYLRQSWNPVVDVSQTFRKQSPGNSSAGGSHPGVSVRIVGAAAIQTTPDRRITPSRIPVAAAGPTSDQQVDMTPELKTQLANRPLRSIRQTWNPGHHYSVPNSQAILSPRPHVQDFCAPIPRLRSPRMQVPSSHQQEQIELKRVDNSTFGPLTKHLHQIQNPGYRSSYLGSRGAHSTRDSCSFTPSAFHEDIRLTATAAATARASVPLLSSTPSTAPRKPLTTKDLRSDDNTRVNFRQSWTPGLRNTRDIASKDRAAVQPWEARRPAVCSGRAPGASLPTPPAKKQESEIAAAAGEFSRAKIRDWNTSNGRAAAGDTRVPAASAGDATVYAGSGVPARHHLATSGTSPATARSTATAPPQSHRIRPSSGNPTAVAKIDPVCAPVSLLEEMAGNTTYPHRGHLHHSNIDSVGDVLPKDRLLRREAIEGQHCTLRHCEERH